MGTQNFAPTDTFAPASTSLSDLAEQLRDGPLQDLIQLQLQATELADRLRDNPAERIEDLEQLVRLTMSAMERFHAFTREFAAVLRDLTDAHRNTH
jgi:hypothetical protein